VGKLLHAQQFEANEGRHEKKTQHKFYARRYIQSVLPSNIRATVPLLHCLACSCQCSETVSVSDTPLYTSASVLRYPNGQTTYAVENMCFLTKRSSTIRLLRQEDQLSICYHCITSQEMKQLVEYLVNAEFRYVSDFLRPVENPYALLMKRTCRAAWLSHLTTTKITMTMTCLTLTQL
jgi:hypothetical protein